MGKVPFKLLSLLLLCSCEPVGLGNTDDCDTWFPTNIINNYNTTIKVYHSYDGKYICAREEYDINNNLQYSVYYYKSGNRKYAYNHKTNETSFYKNNKLLTCKENYKDPFYFGLLDCKNKEFK